MEGGLKAAAMFKSMPLDRTKIGEFYDQMKP